ncbi:MAG: site-2 protease family protein [Haloarculaceae archaeon]
MMQQASVPASTDLPSPESLADTFYVYDVEETDEGVRYYGEPLAEKDSVVQQLGPLFRERGYRVQLNYETGEYVLEATERSTSINGVPWTNVVLFLATVAATLLAGSRWYGIDVAAEPAAALGAWPFALSVIGVLAVHEFGHYVFSRYHDVQATLPYFIPLPFNAIGTLGAVIRMKDNIPSRRSLFDIGVAGPLAGIAATVVVAAVGVTLPPIEAPQGSLVAQIELGYPLLIQGIAALLGEPLSYGPGQMVNPVVVGAWVGAFVTFLNLIPVGQLDGAHVLRALVGDRMGRVQQVVPLLLFGLAGYLVAFEGGRSASIWVLWGFLTLVFSRAGNANPLDESSVGRSRQAVAALTLVLGMLCFTPIPFAFTP